MPNPRRISDYHDLFWQPPTLDNVQDKEISETFYNDHIKGFER